jgi:hypothetical protein
MNKSTPSTYQKNLEFFEEKGTDREWHQIMMYNEVFIKSSKIPGDILEFGVATGSSFKAFVRMNNIFNRERYHIVSQKRLYGFDSFEGLPELNKKIDLAGFGGKEIGEIKKGGFNAKDFYKDIMKFTKVHKNCEIVKGWFDDTIPNFLDKNPHLTCSLIHVDCDIYESTKTVLKYFLSRLNVGGIILFDEIFQKNFPGETLAFIEQYNENNKICLKFKRVKSMPWKWYAIRKK